MKSPTILVATDFSARADRALDRALMICEKTGRVLRVAHALDHMDADKADWNELNRRMTECVGQPMCETENVFPEGSPPRAIAAAGEAEEVEMIVLGPARYNSLGDFFIGTAVDYVLRYTSKPVLVVKQRPRLPYRHIIAGTDFSAGSRHAIVSAARLFPEANVHVVHAWHVPFEGFQRDAYVAEEVEAAQRKLMNEFMASLIKEEPTLADATSAMVRGGPHKAMKTEFEKYCEIASEGLTVVGSHGASGFRQATIGSVTSDLLRFLESDVLVVNVQGAED